MTRISLLHVSDTVFSVLDLGLFLAALSLIAVEVAGSPLKKRPRPIRRSVTTAHVADRMLATNATVSPHIPILGLQLAHDLLCWLEDKERHASLPVDYLTAHRLDPYKAALRRAVPREGNMKRHVPTVVRMPVINMKLTGLADALYLRLILRVQTMSHWRTATQKKRSWAMSRYQPGNALRPDARSHS